MVRTSFLLLKRCVSFGWGCGCPLEDWMLAAEGFGVLDVAATMLHSEAQRVCALSLWQGQEVSEVCFSAAT